MSDGFDALGADLVALFTLAPDPLAVLGFDGRIRRLNLAWESVLGQTVAEIQRWSYLELVHADDRAAFAQAVRTLCHGGMVSIELRFRRARGEDAVLACNLVAEGDADQFYCTARDMTEQRRQEAALQRSHAQFRALIERAPDGIFVLRDERFVYANPTAARIFGYLEGAQMIGLRRDDVVRYGPEGTSTGEGRDPRAARELRLERRDGTSATIEAIELDVEFDGAPATLVIGRDVTERNRAQARLLQTERLASVGTLAAGVAHEINNPLAYVSLNLEMMRRRLPSLGSEPSAALLGEFTTLIDQSREGAQRVRDIVRDLKTFARPDEEPPSRVDVRAVLDSTIAMASHEIRPRARLVRDYADVPPVLASESRLAQVFLNLLVNAAHAIPEGAAHAHEIRVTTRAQASDRVLVSVSDTGEGIAAEHLGRVFDPFFTTKPVGIGTGLGLSVCLGIVTTLGGQIAVQSAPDAGTTVTVTLPIGASRAVTVCSAARARASGLRLLVVDDEPAITRVLATALGGHEVVTAASGAEALVRIGSERFDVVLCDLTMPDVTGMDVYERTRWRDPAMAERFVFMSGGPFTARAREFLESVPNPRLDKPFDLDALEVVLARFQPRQRA